MASQTNQQVKESAKSKPAQHGVIIYSNDIKALSQFYIDMFGMNILHENSELVSLGDSSFNIVIHTPPIEIPPQNFNTVKLFLTVESHLESRSRAEKLGGKALPGEWSNPIFKVCNIEDPEGNHIQLREFI